MSRVGCILNHVDRLLRQCSRPLVVTRLVLARAAPRAAGTHRLRQPRRRRPVALPRDGSASRAVHRGATQLWARVRGLTVSVDACSAIGASGCASPLAPAASEAGSLAAPLTKSCTEMGEPRPSRPAGPAGALRPNSRLPELLLLADGGVDDGPSPCGAVLFLGPLLGGALAPLRQAGSGQLAAARGRARVWAGGTHRLRRKGEGRGRSARGRVRGTAAWWLGRARGRVGCALGILASVARHKVHRCGRALVELQRRHLPGTQIIRPGGVVLRRGRVAS